MQSTSSWSAADRCLRTSFGPRGRGLVTLSGPRDTRSCLGAALTLILALAACSLPALAQESGLTLQRALQLALAQNKQLEAFEHRLSEQAGRLQQAGLYPNPKIDLRIENAAGQDENRGFEGAETTLSIGWAIEPGLRGGRVGVAEARSARTRLDAQILRLDVAAETAQRFVSSLESQAHLEATQEAVALAERTVAAVERRVRAGRAPRAERIRARAQLATERLAHDDVTHELSVAYHRLAAQWGKTAPLFARVEGALLTLPAVVPFDELAARIEENPELTRLASEQRIAEARLRLAKTRRRPSWTPSLGARRFETTDDWALVAGLTVSLPLLDRNQGRIAESRATLARLYADSEAERVRVHATLYEIYQEAQHSVHRAEVLRGEVIPRLEESMQEMRRGYAQGRYRYTELRTSEADLLAARRAELEAGTAAHRLVITLERLTGEGVVR